MNGLWNRRLLAEIIHEYRGAAFETEARLGFSK
jgi:hypothetical protein